MKKKKKKFKKKPFKKRKKNIYKKKNSKKRNIKKIKRFQKRKKKKRKISNKPKSKTRLIILNLIRMNEKIKSSIRFDFNLDRSLQNFFQSISNKISEIKKVIREEKQKQNRLKILAMEREKKEIQKIIKIQKQNELKAKEQELRDEIVIGKERKKNYKNSLDLNKQR